MCILFIIPFALRSSKELPKHLYHGLRIGRIEKLSESYDPISHFNNKRSSIKRDCIRFLFFICVICVAGLSEIRSIKLHC